MRRTGLLLLVGCAGLAAAASPIKHVVVLYEENRAFDHIFGHNENLRRKGADVLLGNESIPKNLSDPSAGRAVPLKGAPYVATIDPNHGMPQYLLQSIRCMASLPRARALSLSTCAHVAKYIHRSRYTLKIFGNKTFTSPSQSHLYLNDAGR